MIELSWLSGWLLVPLDHAPRRVADIAMFAILAGTLSGILVFLMSQFNGDKDTLAARLRPQLLGLLVVVPVLGLAVGLLALVALVVTLLFGNFSISYLEGEFAQRREVDDHYWRAVGSLAGLRDRR